jgi:hypothetical protein
MTLCLQRFDEHRRSLVVDLLACGREGKDIAVPDAVLVLSHQRINDMAVYPDAKFRQERKQSRARFRRHYDGASS